MYLETVKCGICGASLSPAGVCPRCLLGLGFDTEPTDSEETGTLQFGPYRTLRILGEGGMGIVYLAEQDAPIRRRVALKVIKLGMDSAEVIARFESERQALALMSHPHIASVLDAGATESGRPYFVMEYVPGVPITEYCDRYRLSGRQRLELFCQVCQAIHHAHQKGVIHRDIKPSNILVQVLDGNPTPKVIDFGVAKATSQRLTEKSLFTQMGVLIGTPAYMSPEQAGPTAPDVDTTTDIYSLGVVLYELLVGVLPFDPAELKRAGYAEICRIIREDDPPLPTTTLKTLGANAIKVAQHRQTDPRALVRQVRGDLEWITMKAIEKDRTRRYASASELAADIGRHLNDEPVVASPPGAMYRLGKLGRKHKIVFVAAAAVILTLVAGIAVSSTLFVGAERQRALAVQRSYAANIAAASSHLEHTEIHEARRRLFLCEPSMRGWEWKHLNFRLDSSVATIFGREHSPDDSAAFGFTDDGKQIVWNSQDALNLWSAGTFGRTAVYGGFGAVLAFDRNATRVLTKGFGGDFMLRVFDPVSRVLIAKFAGLRQEADAATFSPDSSRAVSGSRDGMVHLWDPASGRSIANANVHLKRIRAVAFSSDGTRIASGSQDQSIRIWDGLSLKPLAMMKGHQGEITAVAFDKEGKRIVSGSDDHTVRLWEVASGKLRATLEGHEQPVLSVAFSPDGLHIVSGANGGMVLIWEIASGKIISRLVVGSGEVEDSVKSIAFTPDGSHFLTAAADFGFNEIRVWDTATWGGTLLKRNADPSVALAFSPDSTQIAAAFSRTIQIWDSNSGRVLQSWPGHEGKITSVAFSPEGKRIATGSEDHSIRLWDALSGEPVRTLAGHSGKVNAVTFSPDGVRIASASDDRTARIWDVATGGLVSSVAPLRPVDSVAFSPDGRRILTSAHGDIAQVWDTASGRSAVTLEFKSSNNFLRGKAVMSPDGRRIAGAVVGFDAMLAIWDPYSGKLSTPLRHAAWENVMAFSPDGLRILSISEKKVLRRLGCSVLRIAPLVAS